jgi:hypothetical protein
MGSRPRGIRSFDPQAETPFPGRGTSTAHSGGPLRRQTGAGRGSMRVSGSAGQWSAEGICRREDVQTLEPRRSGVRARAGRSDRRGGIQPSADRTPVIWTTALLETVPIEGGGTFGTGCARAGHGRCRRRDVDPRARRCPGRWRRRRRPPVTGAASWRASARSMRSGRRGSSRRHVPAAARRANHHRPGRGRRPRAARGRPMPGPARPRDGGRRTRVTSGSWGDRR